MYKSVPGFYRFASIGTCRLQGVRPLRRTVDAANPYQGLGYIWHGWILISIGAPWSLSPIWYFPFQPSTTSTGINARIGWWYNHYLQFKQRAFAALSSSSSVPKEDFLSEACEQQCCAAQRCHVAMSPTWLYVYHECRYHRTKHTKTTAQTNGSKRER